MANYAIVKHGVVQNTIVCQPMDIPLELEPGVFYVEYTLDNPAVIGLGYDGSSFEQMAASATSSFIANLAEGYNT
jgi:hypothetical protein